MLISIVIHILHKNPISDKNNANAKLSKFSVFHGIRNILSPFQNSSCNNYY